MSGAWVLAGQAIAVALTGLAVIVLLGTGRGRVAVAAGVGVLAVDAVLSAKGSDGPRYLSPFYAPLNAPRPSLADDLAWLGEALSAQVTQHWPALLGMSLICGGSVVTLTGRPRTDTRWIRWVAWAAVAGLAVVLLAPVGGGDLPRLLVALAVRLPTMLAVAAGLTVLVVAAGRQRRFGVPAMLGAFLLAAAVIDADLAAVAPLRPVVLQELHSFSDQPGFLEPGIRLESAVALGHASSPGLVTAPLLALMPVLAIALLVLAAPTWGHGLSRSDGGDDGARGVDPGDGDDRRGHHGGRGPEGA
ncbi:hypothetical protein [Micromonospora cremea]|uniref:Uncharacterized protein n=1 Tax=Micromonospora cremea TaxID=709881 RepID=A0A1N5WHK2_9ACTN|nr:hypothetical protein [Micromonospora cremea]SIM84556.1 hypothetical protein SAMN04489832_2456 [Micromonospora cremea]